MNAKLLKYIRSITTQVDKLLELKAVYRIEQYGVSTTPLAAQPKTVITKNVIVRSSPIDIKERRDLTQAGLTDIDAAWFMQTSYHDDVKPGHILEVSGFKYEVASVRTDELNVEHKLYTRRMK